MDRTVGIPQATDGPPADSPPGSLEQVRDILFGGQMRMVDARLHGLEARMQQEQLSLRTDFQREVTVLEESVKKSVTELGERLADERAKRAEDLKVLSSDLKELVKNLERRHQSLEEAASQADAELRDHLFTQGASQSAELAKTADRLSRQLDEFASSLRAEKLDTSALASGLTDLVNRLTSNGNANAAQRASQD